MNNYFQNNTRVFGRDFQNIFNFLNRPNNVKKVPVNYQENQSHDLEKPKYPKNQKVRRNTMYMKFSNFHFDNKNNIDKENKTTLDVIKEEKENIQMPRKTMVNLNDADALTKGAVKDNIKEKKIEIKDYFHALMDDYGDDIFRYLMKNCQRKNYPRYWIDYIQKIFKKEKKKIKY